MALAAAPAIARTVACEGSCYRYSCDHTGTGQGRAAAVAACHGHWRLVGIRCQLYHCGGYHSLTSVITVQQGVTWQASGRQLVRMMRLSARRKVVVGV
jgi:hypothetical protein